MSRIIRGSPDSLETRALDAVENDSPRVIRGPVYDARAEAEQVRGDAKREAERILDEARTLAVALREEARALGFRAGREEAAALLVAARAARERALSDLEPEVASLAVRVGERLLGEALSADPSRIEAVCKRAIEHARRAKSLQLRVSPEDVESVEKARDRLAGLLHSDVPLRIVADASIARGGCTLETDVGRIDGRVETQLAAIERALSGLRDDRDR